MEDAVEGTPTTRHTRAMARRTVGPRRTDSHRAYVRGTQIIAGLSVVLLSGAIVWDLANDGFWSRHALLTGLVASLIVVAVTAAVLNEVLERLRRERWSVLRSTRCSIWSARLGLYGAVCWSWRVSLLTASSGRRRSRPAPRQRATLRVSPRRSTKCSLTLTAANGSTSCLPGCSFTARRCSGGGPM